MFSPDTRSFEEKLEIGNDKEELLVEILNLSTVPARLNNEEDVKDVDIELTYDEMYVDSKYCETPFYYSKKYVGIDAEDCLTISQKHVKKYAAKEKETGKKTWVGFLVDYKDFGIYEYRFFPVSYLMYLIENNINVRNDKLHVNRREGRDLYSFLDYIKKVRKIKGK